MAEQKGRQEQGHLEAVLVRRAEEAERAVDVEDESPNSSTLRLDRGAGGTSTGGKAGDTGPASRRGPPPGHGPSGAGSTGPGRRCSGRGAVGRRWSGRTRAGGSRRGGRRTSRRRPGRASSPAPRPPTPGPSRRNGAGLAGGPERLALLGGGGEDLLAEDSGGTSATTSNSARSSRILASPRWARVASPSPTSSSISASISPAGPADPLAEDQEEALGHFEPLGVIPLEVERDDPLLREPDADQGAVEHGSTRAEGGGTGPVT